MIVLDLSFSVLKLNFSGLKSSKLTNFAGAADNVLSIFISLTLLHMDYILCMNIHLNKFLDNINYLFQ